MAIANDSQNSRCTVPATGPLLFLLKAVLIQALEELGLDSFAAITIFTATTGRHLRIKVNIGHNKLPLKSTYVPIIPTNTLNPHQPIFLLLGASTLMYNQLFGSYC